MVSGSTSASRSLTVRQRERRSRIIDATNDLLARHGYNAVSMRLIAATAGVAERTLFNIYGSKDLLIAASARERSEDAIAEADRDAPQAGIGFFWSLPAKLAAKTFEATELARAFSPVLAQHAELVGLPDIYERYAGKALRAMQADGSVEIDEIAVVSRLVCMRMIATVILWAENEIADGHLETHLRLAICQILLPYAGPALSSRLRREARRCTRLLGTPSREP